MVDQVHSETIPSGKGPLELGIGVLLVHVARAHRNLVSAELDRLDIHVGQEHLVYRLAVQEGLSQSELAEALCLDASTVTKMLLRLERDGVVRRETDVDDARVLRVYLTERGRALVRPVVDIWSGVEGRIVHGLSEAEHVLLRRLLQQVMTNLS